MHTIHFFNISPFAIYQIYDQLDKKAKITLMLTCKWALGYFKQLEYNDSYLRKASEFILENYGIIDQSPKTFEVRHFLMNTISILGMGDTHNCKFHRLLNCLTIRLAWQFNSIIYCEGGKGTLLAFQHDPTEYYAKYLDPQLLKTAKTWDISSETTEVSDKYFDFAKAIVDFTQDFFRVFSNIDELSFQQFDQLLSDHFGKKLIKRLKTEIPLINEWEKKEATTFGLEKRKVIKTLCSMFLVIVLPIITGQCQEHNKNLRDWDEVRNLNLALQCLKVILKKRTGFFIAGSEHIKDSTLLHTMKENYLSHRVPFLFLNPKDAITFSSIRKSFEKRFQPFDFFNDLEEDKSIHQVVEENQISDDTVDKEEMKRRRELLKFKLLGFDTSTMDISTNHFAEWLGLSIMLLARELEFLANEESQ